MQHLTKLMADTKEMLEFQENPLTNKDSGVRKVSN